ncbi:MAG: glycoside hydrolase family 9 protein, partial [Bacteroidota bacterium]
IRLVRVREQEETVVMADPKPEPWGTFLRYRYLRFDFTSVAAEGLYKIRYGDVESHPFEISCDIYSRHVWQPTLEVFLPVQMCHMRIRDRYKLWHGLCHMDDALMAPVDSNHFDGYVQGTSTLTHFQSGEHVPGLNIGGWHDAGDYDLRVESQADTVYKLALAYELFGNAYDNTTVDQATRHAELQRPDGKPDLLQQIEHGLLSVVGGFDAMGRVYRGIISPTLEQYVHLGDATTMSDNLVYREGESDPILNRPLPRDDRLVFTENNPQRELFVSASLAAAGRVLRKFNPPLAQRSVAVAETLFARVAEAPLAHRVHAAAELYLATSDPVYGSFLRRHTNVMSGDVLRFSEVLGRTVKKLGDPEFAARAEAAVRETFDSVARRQKENPFGVPYTPHIWGAGWGIQSFGVKQLFLHVDFPGMFPAEYAFNALNFVLGCHPGENTASFVSGVGVHSLLVAYGTNRDEWWYIPGGVASGTALIRPDLPELKVWPYLWQQSEYVLGGGTADFLLLAMGADWLLNR